MPLRDSIKWGDRNPFSDPRLSNLPVLVREFRHGKLPRGWKGNKRFENWRRDLPFRADPSYYTEFYVGASHQSGSLRLVLGKSGEVYVTGNHYDTFRLILEMPV